MLYNNLSISRCVAAERPVGTEYMRNCGHELLCFFACTIIGSLTFFMVQFCMFKVHG